MTEQEQRETAERLYERWIYEGRGDGTILTRPFVVSLLVEAMQVQQAKSDELIADDQVEINRLFDEKREAERQRDELRSRLDEALALLRQVEWSSSWADGCPVCAADIEEGHADGCKLGAILAATEKATA